MTDKPRRVVVCHPSDYADIQRGVTSLGYGDVLVQPNRWVDAGRAYVLDPNLPLPPNDGSRA